MNAKNFLVSGIIGGIVEYLLGWLFYGILFKDSFPQNDNMNMLFIFLGCMTAGFFIAFIFTRWAQITNPITGLKAGAIIGLFLGLYSNFFMNSSGAEINYQLFALDVVISILMTSLVGAAVAFVNDKMK